MMLDDVTRARLWAHLVREMRASESSGHACAVYGHRSYGPFPSGALGDYGV